MTQYNKIPRERQAEFDSRSFRNVNFILDELELRPSAKILLLTLDRLSFNSNKPGRCWPSMSTLTRKCRVDRRVLIRDLKYLEELDLIERHKRKNPRGGRDQNEYKIVRERLRHTHAEEINIHIKGGKIPLCRRWKNPPLQRWKNPPGSIITKHNNFMDNKVNGGTLPRRSPRGLIQMADKLLVGDPRRDTIIDVLRYYCKSYAHHRGEPHPVYQDDLLRQCIEHLKNWITDIDTGYEVIDRYFQTDFQSVDVDYRLAHLCSGDVIYLRSMEATR